MGVIFYSANHAYGTKKEEECLPLIRKVLGEDVIHDTGTFNKFDFYTDKYDIELKSRTISSSAFTTTYTTPVKRAKANKSNKRVLWLFNFTDGIFYLDFIDNKDAINSIKTEICNTKYGTRHNINIPIKLLQKFDKTNF